MLFSYVFAMAWWNNWKVRASARMWGIIASLGNLLVILIHDLLKASTVNSASMGSFGSVHLRIIVYVWPDQESENHLLNSDFGDHDSPLS